MAQRNLEKEILDKIKRDGIKPKPRLFFVFRNISFWFLSIVFIIFGAISFATILYKISGNYQVIRTILINNFNFSDALIFVIPYF